MKTVQVLAHGSFLSERPAERDHDVHTTAKYVVSRPDVMEFVVDIYIIG
jgi:hypothetical protein